VRAKHCFVAGCRLRNRDDLTIAPKGRKDNVIGTRGGELRGPRCRDDPGGPRTACAGSAWTGSILLRALGRPQAALEETVVRWANSPAMSGGQIGCSNYATWVERARRIAATIWRIGLYAIQQEYTYLWPRPTGSVVGREMLDYLTVHSESACWPTATVSASYGRPERPLPANRGYAHPVPTPFPGAARGRRRGDADTEPSGTGMGSAPHGPPYSVFGASSVASGRGLVRWN